MAEQRQPDDDVRRGSRSAAWSARLAHGARAGTATLALAAACDAGPQAVPQNAPPPAAPQGARAAEPETRPDVVRVPCRRVKHQVLIEVTIRGRGPFTFLVDTGVGGAAIDTDVARSLGIELDEDQAQALQAGPDAGALVHQTWIHELTIGTLTLDRLQAAALPLTTFGSKLGVPLHGILGDGFLGTRVTRFDFAENTLAFASTLEAFAEDVESASYATTLRLSPVTDMPLVEVAHAGKSFAVSIDTGSSLGLEIFTPYAEELGLGAALTDWPRTAITGGSIGHAFARDGVVPAVELGPLRFTEVPTSLTPPRGDEDRKGNLGNAFWRGCVLVFDYPGRRLVIRRMP